MKLAAVRAVVNRNLPRLVKQLHLEDWTISVTYGPLESLYGEVNYVPEMYSGKITLDPTAFDTQSKIIHILRHELIHLVIGDFSLPFDEVKKRLPKNMISLVDKMFSYMEEKLIEKIGAILGPAKDMRKE